MSAFALIERLCPNREKHTRTPDGLNASQLIEWARQKEKTHRRVTCRECGLLAIWVERQQRSD